MRGRDVKFEVWSYSEGEDFPKRRPPFFRRRWKAILLACAEILEAAHAYYRRGDIGAGVKSLARDVADIIQPGIGSHFDYAVVNKFPEKSAMDKLAEGAIYLVAFALIVAWAYYRGTVLPSRTYRSHGSPSRPHASSFHHSSGSSHRSGGGHFGGGGASGGW